MNRQMEERHLAAADRNIAEAEARIDRQLALIERLRSRGENTDTADLFLDLLRQTAAGWAYHREQIILALTA